MFGYLLEKLGILFQQFVVAFFGVAAEQRKNPVLQGYIPSVGLLAKEVLDFMEFGTKLFPVLKRQAKQFGVFNAVNAYSCRGLVVVGLVIGNPPVLQSKLDDMFFAVGIGTVRFQAAIQYKEIVLNQLPFLDHKLVFSEFLLCEMRQNILKLRVGDLHNFFDMLS